MINRVILTGRTTNIPEIRQSATTKVASFTLAVNRRYTQQNQQQADFIRCVVFGKLAELVEQYVSKGMMLGIEGRIQTGSYDDQQTGRKVYTTDIVCDNVQFLETKKTQSSDYQNQQYGYQTQNASSDFNTTIETNDFEDESLEVSSDDLPF